MPGLVSRHVSWTVDAQTPPRAARTAARRPLRSLAASPALPVCGRRVDQICKHPERIYLLEDRQNECGHRVQALAVVAAADGGREQNPANRRLVQENAIAAGNAMSVSILIDDVARCLGELCGRTHEQLEV